jgi:hypothetical protein
MEVELYYSGNLYFFVIRVTCIILSISPLKASI